ncbi:vanadium-dependent haloperoxidase [Amycolatopsis sp. EV170708-02-1]|uniref:vanadium-dependent haloperoxidase n=1 Tax=Amycolatopsis sp. EV170708-02-1 TaxID=2919322 RepID=UPI001F0C73A0|nr:vanadium-dependent haloperoxidase [Amycolatopsis sp. EV170708-02-1]UMP07257.1 vanadium-dependent haloperoxidase [Amycolatopsis sp. EV170708-02-1]
MLSVTVPVVLTATAAQARQTDTTIPRPNAVIAWNLHAQNAIYEVARQSPTAATRSFAIAQGAVYDAVNAIAGTPYEPYLIAPHSRPGDSTPAAVATAAYRTLVWLFPAQADSLRTQYEESLAAIPDGHSKRGGIAVGQATATAMIDARRNDGAFSDATWPVGTAPGQWRPTPPGFLQVGAWFATLKPFIVNPGRYRTPGPPALNSAAYARDLNEVKALGSATSTTRTPDQTEAAIWWDDPRVVEWSIKRRLATAHRLGTLQTARLFAMVDVATADALIACYKEKKRWSFWRPVTAIPLADTDGNPATDADPAWTPVRITAPSAEYPSGHACFTAATTTALREFFGRDDLSFSAHSTDSGTTRHYHSLSQAMAELNQARIWAGVHYRFATKDGHQLGATVARDVLDHAFGPTTTGLGRPGE